MKLLESNEKILKKRFPGVLKKLDTISEPTKNFELINSETFSITINENLIYPYGKNYSKSLINLWARALKLAPANCYTLSGFGIGTHVETLLEISDPSTVFFLVEQNPQWLKTVLSKKDCETLLSNERFVLTTGNIDDGLMEPLHIFPLINIEETKNIIYAPLHALNENYYNRFLEAFVRYFAFSKNLHTTNIGDAALWQEATIQNLPYLIEAPDIEIMRNLFKGLPIILIAAGPSLDEAIPFLKKAQEHAVLVCVNSAYRKLIHSDIIPHITLAGDPREATFAGYEGCDTSTSFLVSPCFANHDVIKLFDGRTFTWSGKNSLMTLMRSRIGLLPGSTVAEKNTISTCIADLAKIWGSTKIFLVGQDLALGADGQSHTKDSIYADRQHLHLNLEDCQYLPGNTLDKVPVHKRLIDFLKAFEQVVADNPDLEFINTAASGAKIKGANYYNYEKALQALGNGSSKEVLKQLAACCSQKQNICVLSEQLRKAILPTQRFSQRILELCTKAALAIESLPDNFESQNYQNHARIAACDAYVNEVNKLLDGHPRDYEVLYDGQTKAELFDYVKRIKSIKASSTHWERLQHNKEYFWALAQGAYFLTNHLNNLIIVLNNQKHIAGMPSA